MTHRRAATRTATIAFTALLAIGVSSCTGREAVRGGFWWQGVTFALPPASAARLGGPLGPDEERTIRQTALDELRTAYAGLRITFSSDHGFYNVSVVQSLGGDAGRSHVLVPLGGQGSINFTQLAALAIRYAPAGADRGAMIVGIGRGIGRAAAHEFAHQILPTVRFSESRDRDSYEYETADRPEEYYGPMHWTVARPGLRARLGRQGGPS